MMATVCSMQPFFNLRIGKQPTQTPLVPALGARVAARLQHSAAFTLYSGEPQPQGPFSFLANVANTIEEKKEEMKPRSRTAPIAFTKPEEQQQHFTAAPGTPRFRSALEQVSYLTNESAMRKK